MNDNDYVILFDENGQPYIAHSIKSRLKSAYGRVKSGVKSAGEGMGRGWRASTKYLLKVGEGAKAQYAYTQAEVDRLMGRGRKAIGQAAAKVKQTASNAAQKGRQALSTASSKARDYSTRTSDAIRRHGSETLKTVQDYANQASNKVKDVAGIDERERRDAAWKNLGGKIDTSSEKSRDAWKDFEKARSEYMKTPLGKIEYTAERAKEILTGQDGTAKEIAEDLVERAKDRASDMADKVKETAKKASDTVKDKASDVADRAKDAAKKASDTVKDKVTDIADKAGVDELQRAHKAVEKAKSAVNDVNTDDKHAQRVVDKAQKLLNEYAETPLGRAQITTAKVVAIATAAGVAATAVPVAALMLPVAAGAVLAKAAQIKIEDIKEDFKGTRYKEYAEEARKNGDRETAEFWEEVYKNNSGSGKIELAKEQLNETIDSIMSKFKHK